MARRTATLSGPGGQRALAPPAPVWITGPGLLLQGCGTFLLPLVVGFVASLTLQAAEVVDTGEAMLAFTAVVLFPISLAQLVGLALKSWRDLAFWQARGGLGLARVLDVLNRHIGVVTTRGWVLLASGTALVVVALWLKYAELGLMAVLALLTFYAVTGWTVLASTFLSRMFERGLANEAHGIRRRFEPTVAQAGDPVEEAIAFRRVPVPWGYLLLVEDPLPVRLGTESRYAVGAQARDACEVRGRLRRTPRGHWHVGPARLWYQDVLGLTRVSLASDTTAELKILPRFRPVEIVDPPRTPQQTPDVVTRPNRSATEDWFRFREYAQGDDTRRIHWRLSLRSGQIHVRQPESREIQTQDVLLVLDTWMSPGALRDAALGADEVMDALVEAWLGIAKSLVERGDRVTLIAAVGAHAQDHIAVERVICRSGESARWQDVGARARWQGQFDLADVLGAEGKNAHAVVVTGRFAQAPPGALPGRSTTWLALDPHDALGPPDPPLMTQIVGGAGFLPTLNWVLRLPNPPGDEENASWRRIRSTWDLFQLSTARSRLRSVARARAGATIKELCARGDAVYRIERTAWHVRLVGVQAGTSGSLRRSA